MERLAESVISMGLDVDNLVLQIALFIGRAEPKLDYFRAPHSACCNASVLDRAFTLRTIRRLKSGRGPSSATCRDADCDGAKAGRLDLETCVFCELVAGKRPISVIGETEDALAFMDIQPVNPGHVLIIPKRHAAYLGDLEPALGGQIFAIGMRVAAALRSCGVRCEGVNLFLADGESAGQEVLHVHLHVFPRFAGDGFGLKFSPSYCALPPRAELDDIAQGIRDAMPA